MEDEEEENHIYIIANNCIKEDEEEEEEEELPQPIVLTPQHKGAIRTIRNLFKKSFASMYQEKTLILTNSHSLLHRNPP